MSGNSKFTLKEPFRDTSGYSTELVRGSAHGRIYLKRSPKQNSLPEEVYLLVRDEGHHWYRTIDLLNFFENWREPTKHELALFYFQYNVDLESYLYTEIDC